MAASPSRSLEGIEVPMIGSDKVQWIELTVPSPPSSSHPSESSSAPLSRNSASCHIIPGDPPANLMWRIHNDLSNALEVVELFPCKEFPERGLRLIFSDSLHPFAYICKNEIESTEGSGYLLYALTISGVAHLFRLRSPSTYISCSVFPQNDVEVFDLQKHSGIEKITAVTATFGCLAIGRHDGSIGCYQIGTLDQNAPGFTHELRDDVGIGRLWAIMSRGKVVGAVHDLIICEIHARKLLFALHSDGSLRVWDLLSHTRILNHIITVQELTGYSFSKLWVGNANYETDCISLALLYRGSLDQDSDVIAVCRFHFFVSEKVNLSPESSVQSIPLEEGRLVDLKITSDKLWILKEDGSMLYDLFHCDVKMEHIRSYGLEEDFVAEQLFQGFEHPSDDLIWTNYSIFSLMKDQVAYFISSIFLRRLLQPGVHQGAALRATILDHKKYLTDFEFQSLTVSGLKKEIFSTIESGGVSPNANAMLCYWKSFCTLFFRHWCENSTPYSLFMDSSTGAIGLIRKNSVSIFRCLEHIEMLIYGSSDELRDFRKSGLILPDNDLNCEILFDILRCMSHIHHQLGRASAAVFYESLVNPLIISSEDVILHLLKTLETGYCSPMSTVLAFQVGVDTAWERKLVDHKNQRKFSIDMLFSLHSLYAKANGWGRVLDVLEKYLKNLFPDKCPQNTGSQSFFNINSSLLVQATSQIARVMLESAFDVLLLLGYLINISAQVHLVQSELSHIKTKLLPMIQDILVQWLILHLLGTTPTESPTLDDFSSRLSSLHIDSKTEKRTWDGKLGTPDFTLACLLDFPSSLEDQDFLCSTSFPSPSKFIYSSRNLCNWIICGWTGEESPVFSSLTIELASILLQHGQYEAAENLFSITDSHLSRKKVYQSIQGINGEWCACLHLMGFCLLARAQNELHGVLKERKFREAVRCFFRAASGEGSIILQNLSFRTGLPHSGDIGCATVWKFYYYQLAMQIFEQYNMSEGACQFALAALEQVDEVLRMNDFGADLLLEPAMTIKGRLWANIFKFNIDLNHYRDAYCAIISNPDEDSKFICLRRFIIVLCERGAAKVLCDGEIQFVGLMEKVERELIWKAERSDILARPNLYRLLYAFEIRRNNWRKAASYMYRYSVRLRKESNLHEHDQLSSALQERLCALSTAINALHHVHPSHAWIDPQQESYFSHEQSSPNKRARKALIDNSSVTIDPQSWRPQSYIDSEMLEKEYVITSAQYVLSLVNDKSAFTGDRTLLVDVVDVLIQESFYDMAFTIILKFWKGSGLKRELERVFVAISQKCCLLTVASSVKRDHVRTHCLLLTSSDNGTSNMGKFDAGTIIQQSRENGQWETLELYLDKYKKLHPRLPVTVAETLLHTDSQIELPLWLVHMFKGVRRATTSWGMTGQESDPAALFRLYVDYGRYVEATNLLLEYLESFASLRPSDIVNRKKMSAVWFPYIAIERLWCHLEELRISGHMVDQCEKLKGLLHRALVDHLKQVKLDSDDAVASSFPTQIYR